ncbi:ParB N-terminal domain-containing protein [Mesorhizobium opportunistum]|uniref:ParB N-terminal domain-containing protein n=1 Tax=unclassified Mesorhizobium TaxID=325217 RepID=UPI003337C66E
MNTAEITIPLAGRAELAATIEAHGLIHNLVTKAPKGAKFEVVAGGRRLGALRLLLDEGRTVQGVAVTKDYSVRRHAVITRTMVRTTVI